MSEPPIVYRCINCGECCKRLLVERQGVVKGLPLLPGEEALFKKKHVLPGYGIGENPDREDFRVISNQMIEQSCPHHRFGGCSMWAYRPSVCRSYPLIPIITRGPSSMRMVDLTCSTFKHFSNKGDAYMIKIEPSSIDEELQYYEEIVKITNTLLNHLAESWFYDLKTLSWIPFIKLLPIQ